MSKLTEILPEIMKGRRFKRIGSSNSNFKTVQQRIEGGYGLTWTELTDSEWELEEEKTTIPVCLSGVRSDGHKFTSVMFPGNGLNKEERRALAYAIMDLLEEFKGEKI